jgi:phosphocarrier protein
MSKVFKRTLTVLNATGLCLGPTARVVRLCQQYAPDTAITVAKGDFVVNGKSIMGLLTLEGCLGVELTVTARGPAAREAIEALTDLFNRGFDRGEECLPIPPAHSEPLSEAADEPSS